MDRISGVVKWFSALKGYGFIRDSEGKEYFAHFSGIVGDGYRTLDQGDRVSFIPEQSNRGLTASSIEVSRG